MSPVSLSPIVERKASVGPLKDLLWVPDNLGKESDVWFFPEELKDERLAG